MAQISLYIDDSMLIRLNAAAKISNCSVSKYVAGIISEKLSKEETEELRKKYLLKQLCGALDDPTFTIPEEIPWENETPRRFDLI